MSPETKVAIIASSSAVIGAFISQITTFLISWRDKKYQKKTLLRQKYEEMFHLYSESLEWIVELNGGTNQETIFALAQSPSAKKALCLCLLYFRKDLGDVATDYVAAQHSYYTALISVYDEKNTNCTAGGQFIMKHSKHEAITKNLFDKKNDFESIIIAKSSKYIIA